MFMSNVMKCGAFGESAFIRDVLFIVSVIVNIVPLQKTYSSFKNITRVCVCAGARVRVSVSTCLHWRIYEILMVTYEE